ncbi:MAG: hypothetical protein FWD60_04720 [Candidatus Azobacteroides sp.]|nr:hypothetical protein [Candidatus Azobacteroides sp.]
MNKVYFSNDKAKILFFIKVKNELKNVSFSNFGGSYSTSDEDEQKEIEKTFYFKKGLIYCSKNSDSKKTVDTEKDNHELVEFPDVTDLNDAVAILKGSPYKIHYSKLKSKDDILSVAKDIGVSFPNLPIE